MGASWFDLSAVAGALDGIIGVSGIDQRVEIKNPLALRGKAQASRLTTEEQKVFDEWRGRPPVVVTCADDE